MPTILIAPAIMDKADCKDPGPRAQIVWRDKNELFVDDQYQRTLDSNRSKKLVTDIARNFKWMRFGVLQTTLRGALIDGQHRHGATLLRPDITEVPCMVWDIPPKDAAMMFVGLNRDRVNITPQAVFKAELKAGDPLATKVIKICEEVGVVLLMYPCSIRQLKINQTTACNTLKYQAGLDEKRLKQTLECCLAAKAMMSSTILMMTFRELTLGGSKQRVIGMLGGQASNYIPSGTLQRIAEVAPVQTTVGVKKYENGTFMDILLRTFERGKITIEIKNAHRWRDAEFIIDGIKTNLSGAVELANKLREGSGFAPLSVPR